MAAVCCNLQILQKVWDWAKEKLTIEEINNKMLLPTDNGERHVAAKCDDLETSQKVW